MSLNQYKLQVLAILSENLQNPQPQLVPTETIAGQMELQLPELRQILKNMDSQGIIQTDPDLRYTLITLKGMNYLGASRI